ncbi:MAG: hybrid sensor histidine kinase/response regulator [Alphaproteobacteria bacterium]|nr:hybrid sensor histidine kinase/response regulator [Alphaproteobacteria bacterium]
MPTKQNIKTLIVEDDIGDATLVLMALQASKTPSFDVTHVMTLKEAIEHATVFETHVILLDLSLPDAMGIDTVSRMRKAAPRLPIVIMTGLDDSRVANMMMEMGAQDYLVKDGEPEKTVLRAVQNSITRMQSIVEREELLSHLTATIEVNKRLLGLLAHDLRNPIGVISGYAELLEMSFTGQASGETGENLKTWLASIREASEIASSLIKEVLSMAMSEAEGIAINRKPFDLYGLTARAVEHNNILGQKKRVRICLDPQVAAAFPVMADAIKLEEVLNNLIGNAIKFSHPGSEVVVSLAREESAVRLSVADKGDGIAPEVRDGLFQPFCHGKRGTAGEGTNGLGLYICDQIVRAHGGRIDVQSESGKGARFEVTLPSETY